MKKLLLLLLLVSTICFAQSKEERAAALKEKKARSLSDTQSPEGLNFKLGDDKQVTWQKIYEVAGSRESLVNILKSNLKANFFTNNLSYEDDRFVGQSTKVKLSSTKGVAMGAYMPFVAFIRIGVKEGKYRVIVEDVVFDGMDVGVASGGISISSATPIKLEDFAVKNSKHAFRKNSTANKLLAILSKDLNSYFTLEAITDKDDW